MKGDLKSLGFQARFASFKDFQLNFGSLFHSTLLLQTWTSLSSAELSSSTEQGC